jgi:uncharacterized membrane protein YheB (UPF0754 family)
MNQWLIYTLIPLISAFIGWFTNYVAIKMLFHPREPRKILFFTVQGIFPKQQQQFAKKLGALVSNELLSFGDIEAAIANPDNLAQLRPLIDAHVDHFLRQRLAKEMPMIAMFIGNNTIDKLKAVFLDELNTLFPSLMQQYAARLKDQLDLEKIVTDKVGGFSSDKLEQILLQIMAREFRFVEVIGGVLGFVIGLLQVLLSMLTSR